MKNILLPILLAATPLSASAETAKTGWIKAFSAAPIEAGAAFETPDFHGTLIEEAARRQLREKLEERGFRASQDGDSDLLTLSIDVETPGPKGRKPLPKSPIQISSYDRDLSDNIYDPKIYAEIVDLPKKSKDAPPEIRVTIYARRGEERIWSGYAGAQSGGASREEIAGGLVAALIDHFGENADLVDAPFALASTAPIVEIIEPAEQ